MDPAASVPDRSVSPVSDDVVAKFERASLSSRGNLVTVIDPAEDDDMIRKVEGATARLSAIRITRLFEPQQQVVLAPAPVMDPNLVTRLSRSSLSPRGSLINAIESADVDAIADELLINASKQSAIELAISIRALAHHPHPRPQPVERAIADGVLMLANRLSSNKCCSYNAWDKLCNLFSEEINFKKLAQFLYKEDDADQDELNNEFISRLWPYLLSSFSLCADLLPIVLKSSVPWWIDTQYFDIKASVRSLFIAHSMCTSEPSDDWELEDAREDPAAREFVLKAISASSLEERVLSWFTEFRVYIDDPECDFVQKLSLPFITHLLEKLPCYDTSFLFPLFSHLVRKTQSLEQDVKSQLITIFKLVFKKSWNYDSMCIEDATSNFLEYSSEVDKFINGDLKTLSHTLCGENMVNSSIELAKAQIIESVVYRLETVAKANQESLKQLKDRQYEYRTHNGKKFKTLCVSFVFSLYDSIVDQKTKKRVFSHLADKLLRVRATFDPKESKVICTSEDNINQLVYMPLDKKHSITYASSTLPTQTPRADGPDSE